MKRLLITLLKLLVSVAIVGYLVYDSTHGKGRENVFNNLIEQPKQWGSLAIAWCFCTTAVLLTFVRWWFLIRALDIPCRFNDAIRISFWGYLLNLAPLGIVGGDLAKVVMLDHEHHGYRAKAVASVFADRVIGLYVLFIVAMVAILATGYYWQVADTPEIRICWDMFGITLQGVCRGVFGFVAISTLGLAAIMAPGALMERIVAAIGRIPYVGHPLESLVNAVRMYRRRPGILALAMVMTVGTHCSFAIGCWFIACGLPGNHLSLLQHFVVMPLSAAMQTVPLPMGPTEYVLDLLYSHTPVLTGLAILDGQGLVVALAYRIINVLIAVLGIPYYFSNRREMAEVIHEADA